MKGIFVHDTRTAPYAWMIVHGYKTIETRSRNVLSACVGERVAIVRTRNGHQPDIIGYVDVVSSSFCPADEFGDYFDQHLVSAGDTFDCKGKGKWFYHLENAESYFSQPLPSSAVRHGRSWCEF